MNRLSIGVLLVSALWAQAPAASEIERARDFRNQAAAAGKLGRVKEAVALAEKAFNTDHSIDSAREIARWLERAGRPDDAARYLTQAVARGGQDAVPNFLDLTVSGLDGGRLKLATLRGKAVLLDFWATWCEPCREQHKLLEQVKQRFRENPDVVFLSISTDEDRDAVKPFLEDHEWKDPVYFEDGLERALRVKSIPTSIILGRDGTVSSRMNGFIGLRFVETVSDRIEAALAGN